MLYSINFKSYIYIYIYIYNGFSQNISCGGHAIIQVSVLFYIYLLVYIVHLWMQCYQLGVVLCPFR